MASKPQAEDVPASPGCPVVDLRDGVVPHEVCANVERGLPQGQAASEPSNEIAPINVGLSSSTPKPPPHQRVPPEPARRDESAHTSGPYVDAEKQLTEEVREVIDAEPQNKPPTDPKQLFWVSSYAMVGFLLIGFFCMVANHLWYSSHAGQTPGSSFEQTRTRVIGNIFAWLVGIFLAISMDTAYTQWLFRCLTRKEVRVRVVDAAYNAATNWTSLFSNLFELPRELPSVAAIAAALCLLGIATQTVPPGTLNVVQNNVTSQRIVNVSQLDISTADWTESKFFQLARNAFGIRTEADSEVIFLGPRSIVSRLSTATAASGQILYITPPFVNSSYNIQFFGPYVQCSDASDTVASALQEALYQLNATQEAQGLTPLYNAYFAYVPDSNGQQNYRDLNSSRNSNQLWVSFKQNSTGWSENPYPECAITANKICQLYNASYDLALTFQNGDMDVDYLGGSPVVLNSIEYPAGVVDASDPTMVPILSYSAYFWAFSELLTGSMGMFSETVTWPNGTNGTAPFSLILTALENSALLGSSDLDCFFGLDWWFDNETWAPISSSPQRAADVAFARNEPLDELIQELSKNVTISLMSDGLLGPLSPALVNVTSEVQQYSYQAQLLWAAYGPALAVVVVVNLMGILAFRHNGFRIDRSFTSNVWVTQHNGLFKILNNAHNRRESLKHAHLRDETVRFDLLSARS